MNDYHRSGTRLWNHVVTGPRNNYNGSRWGGVISFEGGALQELSEQAVALYRPIHQWGHNTADIPQGFNNFNVAQAEANGRAHFLGQYLRQTQWDPVNNVLKPRLTLQKLTNEYGTTVEEFHKLAAFEFGLEDENRLAGYPYTLGVGSCASDSPDWNLGVWQEVVAPHVVRAWKMGDFYIRNAYCDTGPYTTDVTMKDGKPSNPGMQRVFDEIHYFIDTYGLCGPIVIGEFGYVAFPTGHANNVQHYVDNVIAFDRYVCNNGYKGIAYADIIQGIALFTDGDWNNANKQAANPMLNEWLSQNPYRLWDAKIHYLGNNMTTEEKIYKAGQEDAFSVNMDAALQKKMITDGFFPTREERWGMVDGTNYAMQPAANMQNTDWKRTYYTVVGDWGNVKWVQEGTPPIEPSNPLIGLQFGHLFKHRYLYGYPGGQFNAPRNYGNGLHEGLDADVIGGYTNNTVSVLCLYPGVVVRSVDSTGGYGKYVIVESSRNGSTFYIWYTHMDKRYVVEGDFVDASDELGEVGSTGNVYGEHVHITLQVPGYGLQGYVVPDVVDPTPYMRKDNASLPLLTVPNPGIKINVLNYIRGSHRRQFDMEYIDAGRSGTQTTMIEHLNSSNWLYVKGNGEYEHFWVADFQGEPWIFRADDTSEGPDRMYGHYMSQNGALGAPWVPVVMEVGKVYTTYKWVQHYNKSCAKLNGGNVSDSIRLTSIPYNRTYASGKTLEVITLEWNRGEQYDFSGGNVAFRDATRDFWFMQWLEGRAPLTYTKYPCFGW